MHKQAHGLLPPPHEYAVVLWEHEVVRDHVYVSTLLFIIRVVPLFRYIIAVRYTLAKAVSQ